MGGATTCRCGRPRSSFTAAESPSASTRRRRLSSTGPPCRMVPASWLRPRSPTSNASGRSTRSAARRVSATLRRRRRALRCPVRRVPSPACRWATDRTPPARAGPRLELRRPEACLRRRGRGRLCARRPRPRRSSHAARAPGGREHAGRARAPLPEATPERGCAIRASGLIGADCAPIARGTGGTSSGGAPVGQQGTGGTEPTIETEDDSESPADVVVDASCSSSPNGCDGGSDRAPVAKVAARAAMTATAATAAARAAATATAVILAARARAAMDAAVAAAATAATPVRVAAANARSSARAATARGSAAGSCSRRWSSGRCAVGVDAERVPRYAPGLPARTDQVRPGKRGAPVLRHPATASTVLVPVGVLAA